MFQKKVKEEPQDTSKVQVIEEMDDEEKKPQDDEDIQDDEEFMDEEKSSTEGSEIPQNVLLESFAIRLARIEHHLRLDFGN